MYTYIFNILINARNKILDLVYLDNSATTPVCESAIKAATFAMETCWGNPSSLHKMGLSAEMQMSKARQITANLIKCREDEIFFMASGTEANNTAIFSAVEKMKKRGNKIITSAVEHPSVLKPMEELKKRGFEVVFLGTDEKGKIRLEDLIKEIDKNTILISIMLVNNETGAIMPIKSIRDAVKNCGSSAIIHCDAVQAFGKMPIDVKNLGVDLLSFSGHKIHAPKGIGGLYKAKNLALSPYIYGGGQEKGFRSGTESVPLIAAFGAAVKELPNPNSQLKTMEELVVYAKEKLSSLNDIYFNSPEDALPFILNISLVGYRSEILLHYLEGENIMVSSGSACSKGEASGVLAEMGLSADRRDSALRISFSRYNTKADVDRLYEALVSAQQKIRKK